MVHKDLPSQWKPSHCFPALPLRLHCHYWQRKGRNGGREREREGARRGSWFLRRDGRNDQIEEEATSHLLITHDDGRRERAFLGLEESPLSLSYFSLPLAFDSNLHVHSFIILALVVLLSPFKPWYNQQKNWTTW